LCKVTKQELAAEREQVAREGPFLGATLFRPLEPVGRVRWLRQLGLENGIGGLVGRPGGVIGHSGISISIRMHMRYIHECKLARQLRS
jgi:hypothetical protein